MKKIIMTIALVFPMFIIGQTTTQNYVKTTTYQKPVDQGAENALDSSQKIEAISYLDGLGRLIQSIAVRAGGQKQNVISYVEYDLYGRTPRQYLPYATTGEVSDPLDFMSSLDLKIAIGEFYETPKYENTLNPYSEMVYEDSPLNRVYEQAAPGNSWRLSEGHTIKKNYQVNSESEVLYFKVNFSGGNSSIPQIILDGNYGNGQLYKNTVKDENWTSASGNNHTTEEFVNKLGQIILKRTYNNDVSYDTYYIYDEFQNLSFVLSPEASSQIVNGGNLVNNYQEILDKLGYQYKYDYRNRLIEKKIPGKGWEFIVYNRLDQPVLTQDANQRAQTPKKEWIFTKYDAFGRIAYTGIKKANISRASFQTVVNNDTNEPYEEMSSMPMDIAGVQMYYTNIAVPTYFDATVDEILTINYYDEYVDIGTYILPTEVYGENLTTEKKGLATVSKVRVLGTDDWITTITGYDEKGRPIFTRIVNTYLNTEDTSELRLDFVGNVMESRTTHQKDGHPVIVTKGYFTYDHQNRLINHSQQVNNESVQLIASNTYDELGQLKYKRVGGELFESGYTDFVNVSVTNDIIIAKTNNSNSYDAGLATVGKLKGNGGLSFSVASIGAELRVGLNDINTNAGAYDMNYFYLFETNLFTNGYRYRIYTRPLAGGNAQQIAYGFYNADNNDFKIERDGDTLHFIQNDVIITSTQLENPDIDLIGDITLRTPNSEIHNLNFYATNINKGLQKVDYEYNVRGWLTDINNVNVNTDVNDLFNFHINYDSKEGMTSTGSITPLYNGNISQTIWKTANTDSQKRAYGYAYDDLNRINAGFSRSGINYNSVDKYSLFNVSYDKNGNIQGLKRNGFEDEDGNGVGLTRLMDDLTYTYDGNQLKEVRDASNTLITYQGFFDGNPSGTDYAYDVNGNMTADRNKGITSIAYNHLNLPELIKINTTDPVGNAQNGKIYYIYDATGVKQAKVVEDAIQNSTITTSYAGGYIYEDNNSFEELKMFSHPEGYIEPEGNLYEYAFNFTDHLGNVRLTYADSNGDGVIDTGAPLYNQDFNNIETIPSGTLYSNSNAIMSITNNRLEVEVRQNYNYALLNLSLVAGKTYRLTYTLDIDQATGQYYNLIRRPSGASGTWLYHSGSSIQESDDYTVEFTALESGVHKFYFGGLRRVGFPNGTNFPDPTSFYLDNIVIKDINSNNEIISEKNYYPFGLQQKGYNYEVTSNSNLSAEKFTYNGKEKQEELGLNQLDYGNRNYEAALGRFITIDKFAQKYLDKSPYNYGANNPILYADKAGDSIIVSTMETLYDGVDGYKTNVPSAYYTGQTYLASSFWFYNETTKEIDASFYVQQNFTPFLAPGSNNKFTKNNPGIRNEIMAHENGHLGQITDKILKSIDFSVKVLTYDGEKTYSGGVQDILDDIYADYEISLADALKNFKKDNPFKFTKEDIEAVEQGKLSNSVNSALDLIIEDVKDRLKKFNNKDSGHSDANNRSYQYLGGKGNSKYNSGKKRIIFWGVKI